MQNRIKIIVGIIVIAALIAIGMIVVRGTVLLITNANVTASEPDPMFAEPAETFTRPPEMDAYATQAPHRTLDDYVPEVETPVDKTAAELAEEYRAAH